MSKIEILPEAQAQIERMAAVDYSVFQFDKPRIEKAIMWHLVALGQPARPVLWMPDAAKGYAAARDAARVAARVAARDAARVAAWDAAWDAARVAAWDATTYVGLLNAGMEDNLAVKKTLGIWLPFMDAYEAGLFLYWITPKEVIAVPRPVMSLKGNALHNETGPAVHWSSGEAYWFLNGVRMPREIVETPAEKIDLSILVKDKNAEIRREVVRKVGIERVCQKLGAKSIDKLGNYDLLMLDLGDGRTRPYLKMLNPSLPGVYHIEGVAPNIKTVRAALAWRNGREDLPAVLT